MLHSVVNTAFCIVFQAGQVDLGRWVHKAAPFLLSNSRKTCMAMQSWIWPVLRLLRQ